MKVKISYLLASFAAVFLFSFSVQAQEDSQTPEVQESTHREVNVDEDKALTNDHNSHPSTIKDSIQSARVIPGHITKPVKPDAHKNNRKDEEDALSFNFLYYMFQKFKMPDLIDQ